MGVLSAGSVLVAMSAVTPAASVGPAAEPPALVLRSKAAIRPMPSPRAAAPFAIQTETLDLDIPKPVDPRLAASPSSCNGDRALCYDAGSGRIVYKPARSLMPSLPGLTAENLSVKRDRIVLRYSF
jgi:hypothetical protein